jgi:hypothetical protein
VLPVLLRYTNSDYHFGIFKLFLIDKKVIAISRGHAHLLTSENRKDRVTLTPLKTGGQIKLGAYTAGKASLLSIIGALVTG